MIESKKEGVASPSDVKNIAKGRLVIKVRSALTAGLAAEDCQSTCSCVCTCNCHSGGKVKAI